MRGDVEGIYEEEGGEKEEDEEALYGELTDEGNRESNKKQVVLQTLH